MKKLIVISFTALFLLMVVPPASAEYLTTSKMVKLAETFLRKADYTHAEEFLKESLSKCDSPRLKILLSDALLFQGDFDGAEALLKPIAHLENDLEDNAVTAQIKLGMLYENIGRLGEAEHYLKKAAYEYNHEGSYLFLGQFLLIHKKEEHSASKLESDWWMKTDGRDLQVRKIIPYFFMEIKATALANSWWPGMIPFSRERLRAIYKYKGIVTKGDIGRRGFEPGYTPPRAKL